jgi:hypothetical protein
MSHNMIQKMPALLAATTVSTAGLLTVAPAQAKPMLPLAPACEKYSYPTQSFLLNQDNNLTVGVFLNDDGAFSGPASYTVPGKPDVQGSAAGSLSGRYVDFTVNWINGFTNRYSGQIADDGVARGTTTNNLNTTNGWQSQLKFACVAAPAPAAPAPSPKPQQPTAPAVKTATVTSDVDVYPAPNNDGDQVALGILRANSKVELVAGCIVNDWCHVKGAAVPTGQGFVWGALDFD